MKKTKEKEHYLKEIYRLEANGQIVSVSGLSEVFGISKSSVSNMVKKLVAMGLLNSAPYKAIELTLEGRELARSIVAKHRLIELFLVEVMGFDPENVHEIAEEIEHIKIDAFFDRMDTLLGFPSVDPHGSPIPDIHGNVVQKSYLELSEVLPGGNYRVCALKDSSKEFLQYLNDAQHNLQALITQQYPEVFTSESVVQTVSGQERYDLPSDCYLGNKIVNVEYSDTGKEEDFYVGTIAVCNVPESSLARECESTLITHA